MSIRLLSNLMLPGFVKLPGMLASGTGFCRSLVSDANGLFFSDWPFLHACRIKLQANAVKETNLMMERFLFCAIILQCTNEKAAADGGSSGELQRLGLVSLFIPG